MQLIFCYFFSAYHADIAAKTGIENSFGISFPTILYIILPFVKTTPKTMNNKLPVPVEAWTSTNEVLSFGYLTAKVEQMLSLNSSSIAANAIIFLFIHIYSL